MTFCHLKDHWLHGLAHPYPERQATSDQDILQHCTWVCYASIQYFGSSFLPILIAAFMPSDLSKATLTNLPHAVESKAQCSIMVSYIAKSAAKTI